MTVEPLVPAHIDLRDFPFMPLEVARLRDSSIVDEISGDEFRAAILLWCASWHQVPAGSLPTDRKQLSKFAGYGRVVTEWDKVAEGALYGWLECSDGRLYHPVIAEKAIEAWDKKAEFTNRAASRAEQAKAAAQARWSKAEQPEPTEPTDPAPKRNGRSPDRMRKQCDSMPAALPEHAGSNPEREYKGQGQGEADARASAREAALPSRPTITDTAQFAAWIRTLVGQEPVLFAQDTHALARLLDEGCTLADVEAGIAAAMAKPDFRPRQWSQLVGWVRGAAKDRLEAEAKAAPAARTVAKPPVDPELDRRNRLAKATAHFRDEWRHGWPEDMRPGHPTCTTAADVIEEARLAVERERAVYANGLPARRDRSGKAAA